MPVNAGQDTSFFRSTTRSSHAIWRIGKAGHTLGFDNGTRTHDTLGQSIQSQPLMAPLGGTDASSRRTHDRPAKRSSGSYRYAASLVAFLRSRGRHVPHQQEMLAGAH
jgi:hypothetical protein